MGRDFPRLSRPALGPIRPPVRWVPALFRGQRRPGRDADHITPSSAEVKKELSYTSTHPMGPPGPVTVFPLKCLLYAEHGVNGSSFQTLTPAKPRVATSHNKVNVIFNTK
jgi:hypothetical protein